MSKRPKHRDGSQRQRHTAIAEALGVRMQTVFGWEKEGKLQYRIYRYLSDKFYLHNEKGNPTGE